MKLGFCSTLDEKLVRFASDATFDGIELVLHSGSPLDPATASDPDVQSAKELFESHGVEILSVFHFEDYANGDAGARAHLRRAMEIAEELGTPIVTCNAWVAGDSDAEKLQSFTQIYTEVAKVAEDGGFRIAFENCPHGKRNIAWSPAMWERMFNAVPSAAIGLEYDPSHLVWQGIDPVGPIREFGARIYAFHAKDTEVVPAVLRREGILGHGWWRYRIPGWGELDWKSIFAALADIGYDGDMIIEHEDPVFEGDQFEQGLRLGLRHLRKFAV